MNPWLILAAVLALGAAMTGAYMKGGKDRENAMLAAQQREAKIIEGFRITTAEAIAGIEVKHVTVRQQLETQIMERPVYRDCVADDSVFQLTNEAITGQPAGSSQLPATGTDDRKDVR